MTLLDVQPARFAELPSKRSLPSGEVHSMLKGGGFVLHATNDTSKLVASSTRSLVGNAYKDAGTLRRMSIGERVRMVRVERELSQGDLAKAVGVSQQLIGQIETGKNQGTKHIVKLAAALSVSPLWLETGEGEREADASSGSEADRRIEAIKARLTDSQKAAVAALLEQLYPQKQ